MNFKNSQISIFANNVRTRRKNLKMTQEELAEKSGLHRTYIGGIEQMSRNPSLKSMEKIADALNIDLSILTDSKLADTNSKYILCVNNNDEYNFYPIDEASLSPEEIKFLEQIYN